MKTASMTLPPSAAEFTDEDLSMFRESVARFLDTHAPPEKLSQWSTDKVVERSLWREAGAFGMLGVTVPAEYGGLGGNFRHERVIIEEMGARGLEGWGVAVHNMIAAPYLVAYATEAQKQSWLPGIVSGDTVLAIAMTEPSGGSDLANLRTRARLDGDEWVIDGQKTFISNGQTADLVIVACRTGEAGARGVSLIAVPGNAEGFERGRNLDKIGRDAQDTSELFFSGVRVPKDNLLGGVPGHGFRQMMQMLPQERLVIAAMGLAMLERALTLTIDYARERTAFGGTLMDLQNTQFTLADIKTQVTVGRAFVDQCSDKLVAGALDAVTASMAKLWITEAEIAGISRCLQLFGGYGYMNEYPIAQLFRDSRIDTIHGGASEVMKLIIARSL
ncbi:MAG: acyl-CoA dehydrogenase family protein [Hyphomonas sp.]|nr:acyl-CoA dehydrogenase family protein [Hyphomonas sp.]